MSSVLFDDVTLLYPFSQLDISCHHYNWWSQWRLNFVRLHTLNKISPRKRDFHVLPIWARSYQFFWRGKGSYHNFIKDLSPPPLLTRISPTRMFPHPFSEISKKWRKRGRSLQHALMLQTFSAQYQGSPCRGEGDPPLYRPFLWAPIFSTHGLLLAPRPPLL